MAGGVEHSEMSCSWSVRYRSTFGASRFCVGGGKSQRFPGSNHWLSLELSELQEPFHSLQCSSSGMYCSFLSLGVRVNMVLQKLFIHRTYDFLHSFTFGGYVIRVCLSSRAMAAMLTRRADMFNDGFYMGCSFWFCIIPFLICYVLLFNFNVVWMILSILVCLCLIVCLIVVLL